jgi:hypothetical protein
MKRGRGSGYFGAPREIHGEKRERGKEGGEGAETGSLVDESLETPFALCLYCKICSPCTCTPVSCDSSQGSWCYLNYDLTQQSKALAHAGTP